MLSRARLPFFELPRRRRFLVRPILLRQVECTCTCRKCMCFGATCSLNASLHTCHLNADGLVLQSSI